MLSAYNKDAATLKTNKLRHFFTIYLAETSLNLSVVYLTNHLQFKRDLNVLFVEP